MIAGGTLVGSDGAVGASPGVDGETIVAVGDEARLPDADEQVDASGRLVIPGPPVHDRRRRRVERVIARAFRRIVDLAAVEIVYTEENAICESQTDQLNREPREARGLPALAPGLRGGDGRRRRRPARHGDGRTVLRGPHLLSKGRRPARRVSRRREPDPGGDLHERPRLRRVGVRRPGKTLAMAAPPFRAQDDIEAPFEHLGDGVLSVVSTDHNGYKRSSEETELGGRARSGRTTSSGVSSSSTTRRSFAAGSPTRRSFGTCRRTPPGRSACARRDTRARHRRQRGGVRPRGDAGDRRSGQRLERRLTVHEGREVTGRVEKTFVRGELVAEDGEIVAPAAHGQFVERECPDWDGSGGRL